MYTLLSEYIILIGKITGKLETEIFNFTMYESNVSQASCFKHFAKHLSLFKLHLDIRTYDTLICELFFHCVKKKVVIMF